MLKTWDKIHDLFGKTILHPQYYAIMSEAKAIDISLKKASGTVLDVGAGRQLIKEVLEKRKCKYISMDHPTIYKRQRGNVRPDILADICSIPLPNKSVNSVMLLMVLEHLPDPLAGLKEIYRVLNKNGFVYISTVENYPAHDLPDDYFRYRLPGITSLCKTAGFKIADTYSWGNVWQVNANNLNLFFMHVIKKFWDKYNNTFLTIFIGIILYPIMFLSNLFALVASPLDFVGTSKLVNFVIAKK